MKLTGLCLSVVVLGSGFAGCGSGGPEPGMPATVPEGKPEAPPGPAPSDANKPVKVRSTPAPPP